MMYTCDNYAFAPAPRSTVSELLPSIGLGAAAGVALTMLWLGGSALLATPTASFYTVPQQPAVAARLSTPIGVPPVGSPALRQSTALQSNEVCGVAAEGVEGTGWEGDTWYGTRV